MTKTSLGKPGEPRVLRTNQLVCDIKPGIDEKYAFYRVKCNTYSDRLDICDDVIRNENILSVKNSAYGDEDTSYLYIMAFTRQATWDFITDLEKKYKEKAAFKRLKSNELDRSTIIQLIINSTAYTRMNRVTNASGRLLTIYSTEKYEGKEDVREIVTLEFRVAERESMITPGTMEPHLFFNVVTFTNTREKDKMRFKKNRPFETFPKYVLDEYGIRRMASSDNCDSFIVRKTYDSDKNTVQFFNMGSVASLESSRVWYIDRLLDNICRVMTDAASIRLAEVVMDVYEPRGQSCYELYNKRAREIVKSNYVYAETKTESEKEYNIT